MNLPNRNVTNSKMGKMLWHQENKNNFWTQKIFIKKIIVVGENIFSVTDRFVWGVYRFSKPGENN